MDYPEHEKLKANRERADAIGEVWDWLRDNDYIIAKEACPHGYEDPEECKQSKSCRRGINGTKLWPAGLKPEQLVAGIIGIDYGRFMDEKDEMLAELRAAHEEETS